MRDWNASMAERAVKAGEQKVLRLFSVMEQAKIRFEGNVFHWVKWTDFLRQMGFRVAPHNRRQQAIWLFMLRVGVTIVLENGGFISRGGRKATNGKRS